MIGGREVDGGMEGGKPRTGTINDTFCCVQKNGFRQEKRDNIEGSNHHSMRNCNGEINNRRYSFIFVAFFSGVLMAYGATLMVRLDSCHFTPLAHL